MSAATQERPTDGSRPSAAGLGPPPVVLAVLTVLLVPLPLILPPATQAVAVRVLIFAIMAVGWNIMSGFGGMFSFGHAAYFGLGAYTSVWLLVNHGVSPWIGMLAGMVVAALFGVMVGFLALRYRLQGRLLRAVDVRLRRDAAAAGHQQRLRQPGRRATTCRCRRESLLGFMQFEPGSPELLLDRARAHGRRARREHPLPALASSGGSPSPSGTTRRPPPRVGVPVMRTKILTIALSAAITSVAGAFYVQYYFFIDPDVAFGPSVSIQAILPAVIGGVGTIWGPAIGALVLGPLNDITATLLRNPPAALELPAGPGRPGRDRLRVAAHPHRPAAAAGRVRSDPRAGGDADDACCSVEHVSRVLPRPARGGRRLVRRWRRAASRASSGPTAPARRRCSTSWPARSRRTPAPSTSTARDITGLAPHRVLAGGHGAHVPADAAVRRR